MDKPSEAEAEYRKAIAIHQKVVDDNPAVIQSRVFLANHHSVLCNLLLNTGKPSEAEAERREEMELRQKLADDDPSVTEFRNRLAGSHSRLAMLLSQNGEPAKALDSYRQAYEIYQKLADGNPTGSRISWRLSNATSPTCCWRSARQPRRSIPIAKLWRSTKSWLTKIPVSCSKPDKIKADF